MPESCRDRLTRSWESVYFFVKSEKYFFDLDAIRSSYKPSSFQRLSQDFNNVGDGVKAKVLSEVTPNSHLTGNGNQSFKILQSMAANKTSSKSANPGDVWSLTNEGIKEEHFAAFPQKLVKRILECSAPKEICEICGKPKVRVVAAEKTTDPQERKIIDTQHRIGPTSIFRVKANTVEHKTLGWKSCSCGAPFHSALVLDPFTGAGTALLVAHKMGYDWLGIEIVPKYCAITNKRIERHGRVRLDLFNTSDKKLEGS